MNYQDERKAIYNSIKSGDVSVWDLIDLYLEVRDDLSFARTRIKFLKDKIEILLTDTNE